MARQPSRADGGPDGTAPLRRPTEESVAITDTLRADIDVVRPRPLTPAAPAPADATLIAACRRGEARAMEALYHQYKRRVFALVYRIVGVSDAEEVAQDVFVRVFRGLAVFRGGRAGHLDLTGCPSTPRSATSPSAAAAPRSATVSLRDRGGAAGGRERSAARREGRGRAARAAAGLPRDPRAARHRGPLALRSAPRSSTAGSAPPSRSSTRRGPRCAILLGPELAAEHAGGTRSHEGRMNCPGATGAAHRLSRR